MYNKAINNKIYDYLLNKLNMHEYRRGWLKGDCPFCGKREKFGVNIDRNRYNCFVCGAQGTPFKLIIEIEGLRDYVELKKYLNAFEGVEYISKQIQKDYSHVNIALPKEYVNIKLGSSRFGNMARNYLKGRGFDIDDLALKGFGYCREGRYMGYIIIPYFFNNKLVYFSTRKFFGNGPRYDNPRIEEIGIGKSSVIYNLDALSLYDTVYITEGVFNAETIGDEAIATGGKEISKYQISMILKSPVSNIVLLLDPDAVSKAITHALNLSFHKKVKLVYWDGDKDVNDLGREEVMKRINAVKYQEYNDLLKLKHERPLITY